MFVLGSPLWEHTWSLFLTDGGNDRKEERQNYGTRIPMLAYGQINAVKLKAMSTTNKTVTRQTTDNQHGSHDSIGGSELRSQALVLSQCQCQFCVDMQQHRSDLQQQDVKRHIYLLTVKLCAGKMRGVPVAIFDWNPNYLKRTNGLNDFFRKRQSPFALMQYINNTMCPLICANSTPWLTSLICSYGGQVQPHLPLPSSSSRVKRPLIWLASVTLLLIPGNLVGDRNDNIHFVSIMYIQSHLSHENPR